MRKVIKEWAKMRGELSLIHTSTWARQHGMVPQKQKRAEFEHD
jgi:hypothetical protein